MESKVNCSVMLRCTKADHESLKRLAQKLAIPTSTIARVALRQGLQMVSNQGIQVEPQPQEEKGRRENEAVNAASAATKVPYV